MKDLIGESVARYRSATEIIRGLRANDVPTSVWVACAVAREGLRFVPAEERRPLLLIESAEQWARSGFDLSAQHMLAVHTFMRAQDCKELLSEIARAKRSLAGMEFITWAANATIAALGASSPTYAPAKITNAHGRRIGFGDIEPNLVSALVESRHPRTQHEAEVIERQAEAHLRTVAVDALRYFYQGGVGATAYPPRQFVRRNPSRRKRSRK